MAGKGIAVMPADMPKALDLGFFRTDVTTTHTGDYRPIGDMRGVQMQEA